MYRAHNDGVVGDNVHRYSIDARTARSLQTESFLAQLSADTELLRARVGPWNAQQ
jgi:hypothetical protein